MSEKQDETVVATEIGLAECRTCLQALDASSVLVDLFQCWVPLWDGMESTIAEDLAKLANIKITQTDSYSKVICEPCCLKLQSACDFACSVRKNDMTLRLRNPSFSEEMDTSNRTIWPKPIQLDKNVNGTVYENVMDVEIKQEALSEDEYANNNVMDELAVLDIKIEPEELIQPMQLSTANEHEVESQAEFDNSYAIFNGYPKTAAERMREYRARKKKETLTVNHQKQKKSAAERAKEYRIRKKMKIHSGDSAMEISPNPEESSNAVTVQVDVHHQHCSQLSASVATTSHVCVNETRATSDVSSIHPGYPKTAAERMREYRARKKKETPTVNHQKQKKSVAERVKEWRIRKKSKISEHISQSQN